MNVQSVPSRQRPSASRRHRRLRYTPGGATNDELYPLWRSAGTNTSWPTASRPITA